MQIFARLTKVNEAERTVEGIIASEAVDRSGEVFDYERSVPHFKSWSEGIAKATEGKNLGNVRVMHGKAVAGITKTLNFDDASKQITVKAEIVDDNEWKKVQKGCYTGFSIGGRYGDKWDDPVAKGVQRYEAIPNEYSLVDLPCNPEAQFTVIKADGSEELRKFETSLSDEEALRKWAEGLTDEQRAMLAKVAAPSVEPVVKDFTEQAERLAKNGAAAPCAAAIASLIGYEPALEKGLWTVASFAEVLDRLSCITDCSEDEAAWEGDNSPVPAQLRAALKPLADAFLAMAREEVTEAIKPANAVIEVIELADKGDLAKAMGFDDHNEALKKWHEASQELAKVQGELTKAQADLATAAAERDTAQASLSKVTAERDDTLTKLTALANQHAELLKRAEPPKGSARVVPVEKTMGIAEPNAENDDEPVKKADGSIDHVATAEKQMRKIYKR